MLARRLGDIEESLCLPAEHLVGQPLERLAQHDEAPRRITGPQVQVGQPAAAAPVTPFGGQHHQVQRVPWLDLDPFAAPAAGRVGGVQRLHHHAFMSPGHRVREERLGVRYLAGHQARDLEVRREDFGHQRLPDAGGLIDEVPPVQVQQVEKERRQRDVGSLLARCRLGAGPAGGDLEGPRPPGRVQRDGLTVQDQGLGRTREHGAGDLGQPGSDVIQSPGKHRDLAALPVHLDPDSVDLPLDRGRGHPLEGGRHGRRGGRQHRPQRPSHLKPERPEGREGGRRACVSGGRTCVRGGLCPCVGSLRARVGGCCCCCVSAGLSEAAPIRAGLVSRARPVGGAGCGQGRLRDRGQRTAEQEGPADLSGGHPGGPRHSLDHHAFQRTLVQFASQQPGQERLLGRGRAGEQGAQQPAPLGLGPLTGGGPYRRKHGVGLGQGQRPGGRARAGPAPAAPLSASPPSVRPPPCLQIGPEQATECRVTHPDLPLAKFPGEERDRDRDLTRRRPAQQPGDLADLDPAGGRQRYRV